MKCTLMNKNIPVLQMEIDINTSYISEITKSINMEYMPIGDFFCDGLVSAAKLSAWWSGRAIPASRDNIKHFFVEVGISGSQELMNKALGLSLSDQYWLKPADRSLAWQDINFFNNSFSEDMGKAFFSDTIDSDRINLISPDNTSDGWLKKKWVIIDNERYLLKAGSKPFMQEPFNEVVASRILKYTNNVNYVEYTFQQEAGIYFSKCKNFINECTEFVPAYNLCAALPRNKAEQPLVHLRRCMEKFRINDGEQFINDMLILDYLILNTDRHWGNFGFIRNIETLEFMGAAPIFDNGTSLWNNELKAIKYHEPSKPFNTTHAKQIKHVQSFANFDITAIKKNLPDIFAIMHENRYIEDGRFKMLFEALESRIETLEHLNEKKP